MKDFDELAYPFEGGENNGHQPHSGMTLRDHFAGLAMQAFISTAAAPCLNGLFEPYTAKAAYKPADAMLEERKK